MMGNLRRALRGWRHRRYVRSVHGHDLSPAALRDSTSAWPHDPRWT
jgi:hypothetical protein